MKSLTWLAIAFCLANPLSAQTSVISPTGFGYATKKGNSVMQYPFSYRPQHRWQQVHGDLKGRSLLVRSFALRQGGCNSRTALARKVTCEVWVGDGAATVTSRFASNWVGAPKLAMKSKVINVPSFARCPSWPAPFNVIFPLDTPHLHTGKNALAWEIRVSTIDYTNWTYFDFHRFNPDTRSRQRRIGTGCKASTTPSNLPNHYMDSWLRANVDSNQFRFTWRSWYGVKNAPTAILLGATQVNVPVPGLCENIFVGTVFGSIVGRTPASGHWTNGPTFNFPYDPSWAGAKVYSQTACVDPNQKGGTIPVCVSRGEENTLPAMGPKAPPVASVHANGSNTAATGSVYRGSVHITWIQ